jgi:hypothetical protein
MKIRRAKEAVEQFFLIMGLIVFTGAFVCIVWGRFLLDLFDEIVKGEE